MKKLDDRVRACIGECIYNSAPVEITAGGTKRQLACWAMKVALLLNLWVHDEAVNHPELVESVHRLDPGRPRLEPYVPFDDFAHLYKHQAPPAHALVWFGAKQGDVPDFFVSSSALSLRTPTSLERVGYYVLFTLSNLLVYVLVGTPEREDVLSQALGTSRPSEFAPDVLVPVSPLPSAPIRWPPPRKVNGDQIVKLTGASVAWQPDSANRAGSWRPGEEDERRD